MVPVAVTSLTVALAAIPANAAVYVPPNASATLVSANPANNTPHAQNGSIRAFAQIGTKIYAGGSFTSIKNAGASSFSDRAYLVAYDAATGVLDTTFNPALDNAVQALAVSPDGKLIVGGNFSTVNGVSRRNLVELDPATGATVPGWAGRADGGVVRRTVVRGNQLYIAGAFHWVNGTEHSLLARLNATTGAIDPTFQVDAGVPRPYPNTSELIWAIAVSPDGGTLVATGNFTLINGAARNQVAMVDLSGTPTVADWNTDRFVASCYSNTFPFYARDVDFSDDGSYFVVVADGGRGDAYCDSTSRWETADRGTNVAATWVDFTGTDSVTSVEVSDGVVYTAGHFRWLNNANGNDSAGAGAVNRYGIGALDASNGVPLNWNPTRSGGSLPTGATSWGPVVWELWRGPAGLYVGQDSDGFGNEYHGRQALLPISSGRGIGVVDAPQAASGYLYLGAGDGQLTKTAFGPGGLGTSTVTSQPNVVGAKAAFMVSNRLYWAETDAGAPSGSTLNLSVVSGSGSVGAPWVGSGYNSWFQAASMTGAFYLRGRMYYTTATGRSLTYRYLANDGYVVGCTAFTLPTTGIDWRTVRGMTWVDGKIVYGSTDGSLRSVPFDPTATSGFAVDATAATVVAAPTAETTWSNPTLYFATS
ncbi:MAG TPA: delta-60 repeat domain-containing protein [Actinoplanes sp.]